MAQTVPEQLLDVCGEDPSFFCEQVLDWTDSEFLARSADWLIAKPLRVALIILVAWLLNRLARRAIRTLITEMKDPDTKRRIRRVRETAPISLLQSEASPSTRAAARAETVGLVLRSVTTAFIYTVAFIMVLGEFDVNLGPLIAGAGIAGVALGFGAQSLVKDFLSGMFMLLEDQFGVGDVIDVGEAAGVVEAVTLRSTRLRDVEGTVWHVPNGEIRRVGNKSQQWARAVLDIEVAYDTDIEAAQATVGDVARAVYAAEEWRPIILEEPEVWGIENLGVDGVAIRLVIKTEPGEQWKVAREIRRRLKAAFDERGIEIPFPQRTVWVRQGEAFSPTDDSTSSTSSP